MKYMKNYNESQIHNLLVGAFLSLGLIGYSNTIQDKEQIVNIYEKEEPVKDTILFLSKNKIELDKKYDLDYINSLFVNENQKEIHSTLTNLSVEKKSPISFYLFSYSEDEGVKNMPIVGFDYQITKDIQIMFFNTGVIKDNMIGVGIRKTF